MKRLIYISFVLMVLGCQQQDNNSAEIYSEPINSEERIDNQGGINYKGNQVNLSYSPSGTIIEKIEEQRDNIIYRITKVDTKSHLLRQGIKDSVELKQALVELKNEQLFYIEFEEGTKRDLLKKEFEGEQYSSAIKYLMDQIQTDFIVICEQDTLKPSFVNYERNFHVAPFERLLLGFSEISTHSDMELLYKDQLFGKGLFKFSFPSESYIINNSDFVL